jgi:hypothetical protein
MVGLGRVELPTSRLSGVRSNQLSYRPIFSADNFAAKKSHTSLSEWVRFRRGAHPMGRVASVAIKLPAIYFSELRKNLREPSLEDLSSQESISED